MIVRLRLRRRALLQAVDTFLMNGIWKLRAVVRVYRSRS